MKKKSGFGEFNETLKTKWDYFKNNDCPVCVFYNGNAYCGKIKEINPNQNYISLNPSVIPDADGTGFSIENKPIHIPFDAIPSSIKEETLEEYLRKINDRRLQERILKEETTIIIPRPKFKI